MPIYELDMTVEIATPQKAAAIRDRLRDYLQSDPEVTLISWQAARATRYYRVWGVNISNSTPFDETVEAVDEAAARALYSAPKVIAAIREG